MGEFTFEGSRIAYDEYGSGDRVFVMMHGLLMNAHMFDLLGPEIADRGNRVICLDLLGHGRSDKPNDLQRYSMPLFSKQVEALLDHLGVEQAVVGGTSLGANVTLELATREPDRVKALFLEMPVLEDALAAVAGLFTPVLLSLRFGKPFFGLLAKGTSLVPRTTLLADIALDWIRRDPDTSIAVLEGLLLGETAPPTHERRKIEQPALIVRHTGDPLHPFSDSEMLAEEIKAARVVDAKSPLEWRIRSSRLNDELATFLDHVWSHREAESPAVG